MAGTFGLQDIASLYDPSVAGDQLALQRRMAIAQALRQQSLSPIDLQGRQIGGMGYAVSPLEGVAKIVQAMSAQHMENATDAERLALAQKMAMALRGVMGEGQGGVSSGVPSGAAPESGGMPASAPTAGGSPSPGMTMGSLIRGGIVNDIGGPAMGAAYAKGFEPTDMQRSIAAAGIDPNSALGHQLVQGNIAKQNYIAPTSARPGGFLQEPNGKITNLPQTQPGFVSVQDENSPTGFRTVEQPGGLSSIGAAEGAKVGASEQAKAPYEFHMVKTGSGAEVPISTAQLAQGLRNYGGGVSAPSPAPAIGSPVSSTNPAANDPWATLPKRAVPGGIGQTSFDAEMAKEQAQSAAELAKKYGEAANAANQRIALNNQALSLVDKSDTGPAASKIADVKNILVSRFNVPEGDFENTPSATISLQKDLLNAAVQRAKQQFGARITQQEVMLMLSKGAPNVDMPKAAIKYLISSDNAMNQYAIQQSNDFGKAMQLGGDPMKFDGWYSQAFPASKALAGIHLNTGKQAAPQKGLTKNADGSYTYNP